MIQDIAPHKYDNSFIEKSPKNDDYVLIFNENKVILKYDKIIPKYKDIKDLVKEDNQWIYLFSIDNKSIFTNIKDEVFKLEDFQEEYIQIFRELKPSWMRFAGVTAYHLYNWYRDNRFCGRCASEMNHSKVERALVCKSCGNTVYPKISPGIIVGIINGNKILLTKYTGREYTNYALVAGFTEIGETLEDTVKREVMEEVGLKVKNIRYYKNQPWAFSSSLLVGFFADLDGEDLVKLDQNELSKAEWFDRVDIPQETSNISLTHDMMQAFRNNEV